MQFRMGGSSSGGSALIGCGTILALFGILLALTPFGVWMVRGLGWAAIVLGVAFAIAGIFYWLSGPRRRYF